MTDESEDRTDPTDPANRTDQRRTDGQADSRAGDRTNGQAGDRPGSRAGARPARRRPSLDEIFGDVLPATTSDEREPEPPRDDRDSWYEQNRPPHHDRG